MIYPLNRFNHTFNKWTSIKCWRTYTYIRFRRFIILFTSIFFTHTPTPHLTTACENKGGNEPCRSACDGHIFERRHQSWHVDVLGGAMAQLPCPPPTPAEEAAVSCQRKCVPKRAGHLGEAQRREARGVRELNAGERRRIGSADAAHHARNPDGVVRVDNERTESPRCDLLRRKQ